MMHDDAHIVDSQLTIQSSNPLRIGQRSAIAQLLILAARWPEQAYGVAEIINKKMYSRFNPMASTYVLHSLAPDQHMLTNHCSYATRASASPRP